MGDALSVASGAAGIISLGLQVCKSLVDYYNAWKDFGDDISSMHDGILHLSKSLQTLSDAIQVVNVTEQSAVVDIQTSIQGCEAGILKLKRLLEKISCKEPRDELEKKIDLTRKLEAQRKGFFTHFVKGLWVNFEILSQNCGTI